MGVASKHFGPIVLALNQLMKDVTLFLITFTVVMVAFASGVSYIFNMASGTLATVMEPCIHPFQGPVIQQKSSITLVLYACEKALSSLCMNESLNRMLYSHDDN